MIKRSKVEIVLSKDDVRAAIEYWLTNEKGVDEDAIENASWEGLTEVIAKFEDSEEE